MSSMARLALLILAVVAGLLAQTGVRSGAAIRSPGAARPRTAIPATPTRAPSPITASRQARPDARLGAGGVSARTGNIVYPGTPRGGRPGSITSPGLPNPPATSTSVLTPGTPTAQQPAPAVIRAGRSQRDHPRRGQRPHAGYSPVYWPVYGYEYGSPSVVEVQPEVATDSRAEHAVESPSRAEIEGRSRVYEVGEEAQPDETPQQYWLIALKGGLIYAAERYWMQNGTFRFRTLAGKEFIISPIEIDLEFSRQLNAERGLDFDLP